MMMYKLLAELDFRHFQQTGLPVTNLVYKAHMWGPLPQSFHDEITDGEDLVIPVDFADSISVIRTEFEAEDGKTCQGFKYIPKRQPNLKVFSPRQQQILKDVADIYKTATATEASKASHEPGKPWTITIKTKGELQEIDLVETLELDEPLTKEIARERLRERRAIIHNLGE
jgi:hypothetical protein